MRLSSPKDHAILETEYKENPKPNKAARSVIVEKVDMNEKEVQVSWRSSLDNSIPPRNASCQCQY